MRRRPCRHGGRCYRQNPDHKSQFSHPGDFDWEVNLADEDDDDGGLGCAALLAAAATAAYGAAASHACAATDPVLSPRKRAACDDEELARKFQKAEDEAASQRMLQHMLAPQQPQKACAAAHAGTQPQKAAARDPWAGAYAAAASSAYAPAPVHAPPASVTWAGRLDPKHTDPQPLPGQTLRYRQKDWPPHKWEVRTSDEIFAPFDVPPTLAKAEVEVYRHHQGQVLGAVLRNVDSEQGRSLARSLQGVYGSHVLGGRGTKNNCSNALGETCSNNGDKFCKIWPIRGEAAGGNHDGDTNWDRVILPLASTAIRAAHMPGEFPLLQSETTRGSVQILRFRAVSGMPADLKPAKQRSDGGDRIHMHVDRDALIDTVMLMTLGDTARFSRM